MSGTQLVSASMDATSPCGGSSSSSSSSSSSASCQPLVFLSFRGSDTRKNFTDHLYKALTWAGIPTYRDENEMKGGDAIVEQIMKAIEVSRMSLIVFSPNFASSAYCLDEVVKIMDCKRSKEYTVVPIFYNVSPEDVSEDNKIYHEALRKLGKDVSVSIWQKALREVLELDGMVLGNRHEADFIQEIIRSVEATLNIPKRYVPSYIIGIDTHIEDINKWLAYESDDVGIAMIRGIGGVGKTAIANIALNMNFGNFDAWSFLSIVNPTSKEKLAELRSTLLLDISGGRTRVVEHALCNKRSLIVLDDLDNCNQLEDILGDPQRLCKGSKIIITTRRTDFLRMPYEASKEFEINGLKEDHSLALFNLLAFCELPPDEDYVGYARKVVQYCSGLPLAIQVLGRCLYGKGIKLWERASQEPETIDGSGRIVKTLEMSYMFLNERDKILFLDVACFFIGRDMDCVVQLMQASDCYRPLGIEELIDRSLVSIDQCNKLAMHQLVRDMARGVVLGSEVSIQDPGERSRLWHYKDVSRVLSEKTGKRVRSLILDPPKDCDEVVKLEGSAFAKMRNLRLLHVNNAQWSGNFVSFPKRLLWLCWLGFPLKRIPDEVSFEDLVVLEMRNSSISVVCGNAWLLPNLKVLDLSHSCNLTAIPDFSCFPKLERLILRGCTNLVDIHSSLGGLERLYFLDVSYCTSLSKLPRENGNFMSLMELHVSGCPKLVERYSLGPYKMRTTSGLVASLPHFLVTLSLRRCNRHAIPEDLSSISSLKFLHLNENPLTSLPETIKTLKMLLVLSLFRCDKLKSLPELPSSVQSVMLFGCSSLKRITNLPRIYSEAGIHVFIIAISCGQLVEVKGIFKVEPVRDIDLDMMMTDLLEFTISMAAEALPRSETTLFNRFTFVKRSFRRPQILHEFGVRSIFCSASTSVPNHFKEAARAELIEQAAKTEFLLPIDVPSKDDQRLLGLVLIVVYRTLSFVPSGLLIAAKISNETKSLEWTYKPTVLGISNSRNGSVLWLSHWMFGHQVEMGDQLMVSVHGGRGVEILTCGVHFKFGNGMEEMKNELVHEEGEVPAEASPADSFALKALCDVVLSAYEFRKGKYELDNSLDQQVSHLLMQAHNYPDRPKRSDLLGRNRRAVLAEVDAWFFQVSLMMKAVQDDLSSPKSTTTMDRRNPPATARIANPVSTRIWSLGKALLSLSTVLLLLCLLVLSFRDTTTFTGLLPT